MVCSGGRTNLKVWGAPVQSISGDTGPAGSAGKNVLVVPLHFFALKAQLVILVSAFLMVSIQFGQFLVAVLLLTVPPRAQSSVKVGEGTCPPCPMESASLMVCTEWPKNFGTLFGLPYNFIKY